MAYSYHLTSDGEIFRIEDDEKLYQFDNIKDNKIIWNLEGTLRKEQLEAGGVKYTVEGDSEKQLQFIFDSENKSYGQFFKDQLKNYIMSSKELSKKYYKFSPRTLENAEKLDTLTLEEEDYFNACCEYVKTYVKDKLTEEKKIESEEVTEPEKEKENAIQLESQKIVIEDKVNLLNIFIQKQLERMDDPKSEKYKEMEKARNYIINNKNNYTIVEDLVKESNLIEALQMTRPKLGYFSTGISTAYNEFKNQFSNLAESLQEVDEEEKMKEFDSKPKQ